MAHKNDFIRFVDKRITKNNDNILYTGMDNLNQL